jgi:hypothetical protein
MGKTTTTNPASAASAPAMPELLPPAGGSWLRQADGSLIPADERTAIGAGLAWPPGSPPADPTTLTTSTEG